MLAAADGQSNQAIRNKYKVTLDTARLWRTHWTQLQDIALGDLSIEERLRDAPRPGAPAQITADQRCQIEALACEKPEKHVVRSRMDSALNRGRIEKAKDCKRHLSATCGEAFKKMLISSRI